MNRHYSRRLCFVLLSDMWTHLRRRWRRGLAGSSSRRWAWLCLWAWTIACPPVFLHPALGSSAHFYIKKMTETELKEMERAAVATATDHGLEVKTLSIISWVCKCTYKILLCNYLICLQVLGMVRVPLYFLKNGGGLPYFLSHSFISNSRAQLLSALQRCRLLSQGEVEKALRQAEQRRRTHRGDPHWHQLTQRCLFTPGPQLHHSSPTPSWFNQIQHALSVDNLCLRGSDLFNIP